MKDSMYDKNGLLKPEYSIDNKNSIYFEIPDDIDLNFNKDNKEEKEKEDEEESNSNKN